MSKRTNIVKILNEEQKKALYLDYLKNQHKTKKSFAKSYGISTRTLGRVIEEQLSTNIFTAEPTLVYDYTVTKNQVTIFCNEDSRSVAKDYPKFKSLRTKLMESDFSDEVLAEVYELLNLPKFVEKFSEGNITVDHENGKVFYGTFEIKNSLADHMMKKLDEGEDIISFVKFADMLMSNPKQDIVEELYGFMNYTKIEIDSDGFIVAFKGVKPDYTDWWTGTISNKVGQKPVMPRSEVEHDPNKGCGKGLHAGSYEYAKSWARDGHIMIVKINPSNVCSVPWCTNSQKMRTCGYEVIGEA